LSVDVRTEVGQALQQEPTVLAPKPKRGSASGLMRYAMAASFALAGVVGWAVWQSQPEPVPGLMAQAVSTPQGGAVQVSAELNSSRNSYLQAHRDMMAAEGLERVNLAEPVSGVAR
jgi:sigma-E factor negative regulatory protein RseA